MSETEQALRATEWEHEHSFGNDRETRGESRTRWIILLTLVMMVAELVAGSYFGSMALLADGWHMGTHAAALGVAVFAYVYARRHARDSKYTFGTGKVFALAGFGSAVGLFVVALMVFGQSAWHLAFPVRIHFNEAILVAAVGLAVNLISAFLLGDEAQESGGHGHGGHGHGGHAHGGVQQHQDHNLRAAYLHVLADALTSVLAILALTAGKYLGWMWLDPLMGLVGSLLIAHWSVGLLRDTSRVLLDSEVESTRLRSISDCIEGGGEDRVTDLHLWRVGPKHLAGIVAVATRSTRSPDDYRERLAHRVEHSDLVHVTVEVNRLPSAPITGI